MIHRLSRIIGIQDKILGIDRQSEQSVMMTVGLWAVLTLSTACSAYISATGFLPVASGGMADCMAFGCGAAVFVALVGLYRRLLCMALFSSGVYDLRILGLELSVCLISCMSWGPAMMSVMLGSWIDTGQSVMEIMTLHGAAVSFMGLCIGLMLLMNVISLYALLLSCRWHRRIATRVYGL